MPIDYRLLLPDEYELARPLLGDALPNPSASALAGAFDADGHLVGVLALQLQWHMEPLTLSSPRVNYQRLKQILDLQLSLSGGGMYYAFTQSEAVMNMALAAGMVVEPMMVLKGVVKSGNERKAG